VKRNGKLMLLKPVAALALRVKTGLLPVVSIFVMVVPPGNTAGVVNLSDTPLAGGVVVPTVAGAIVTVAGLVGVGVAMTVVPAASSGVASKEAGTGVPGRVDAVRAVLKVTISDVGSTGLTAIPVMDSPPGNGFTVPAGANGLRLTSSPTAIAAPEGTEMADWPLIVVTLITVPGAGRFGNAWGSAAVTNVPATILLPELFRVSVVEPAANFAVLSVKPELMVIPTAKPVAEATVILLEPAVTVVALIWTTGSTRVNESDADTMQALVPLPGFRPLLQVLPPVTLGADVFELNVMLPGVPAVDATIEAIDVPLAIVGEVAGGVT
jgi:hypothetical protein